MTSGKYNTDVLNKTFRSVTLWQEINNAMPDACSPASPSGLLFDNIAKFVFITVHNSLCKPNSYSIH